MRMLDFSICRLEALVELFLDALPATSALSGHGGSANLIVFGNSAFVARLEACSSWFWLRREVINGSMILAMRTTVLISSFHANTRGTFLVIVLCRVGSGVTRLANARLGWHVVRCLAWTAPTLTF